MERLRGSRPAFYNEADFQHALAFQMQCAYPDASVRLEVPLLAGGREYLDIFVDLGDLRIAIELKYPRARFEAEVAGEPCPYRRGHPDAVDDTRYYIAKDLERLERLVTEGGADVGVVLVLTNNSAFWRSPPASSTALDSQFRIHEDRVLRGTLEWGSGGRAKPSIALTAAYPTRWFGYSELHGRTGTTSFRYLILQPESEASREPGSSSDPRLQ
jgi:hypothetical protein